VDIKLLINCTTCFIYM